MIRSPYSGLPESSWLGKTRQLISQHPLKPAVLLEAAISTWTKVWQTTVGAGALSVKLKDLKVPATVVGYFFEVLLARDLERRAPKLWRGNKSKDEKDLVYLPNSALSVEIKTSGQRGFKVYGNRSYGQKPGAGRRGTRDEPRGAESEILVKKEKSGFYVTVNFFKQTLTLIRFGWIDADDWDPQEAPTGQMAGLKKSVYDYKLIAIPGSYRQKTPVLLLAGVGAKTEGQFANLGIRTIGDLVGFKGELPRSLARVKEKNESFLDGCAEIQSH